jgi:restriction system protein
MARQKESFLDAIAAMPWRLGVVTGIIAFVAIRYGVGWYFISYGGPIGKNFGEQFLSGAIAPLAWIIMLGCWMAAGVSYHESRRRHRLLEAQTGLESLAAMRWQDFERLVGEAFRRRGYAVEETGLGGADGGIDLILRKDGRKELVQCKQWRTRQVKANVVREMWGLVAHHHANGVKIVCIGDFTRDAEEFAAGKAIELIHGERLLELIREVQSAPATARITLPASVEPAPAQRAAPACPKCGGAMVQRANRTTNKPFWGCSNYPTCKGTLEAS